MKAAFCTDLTDDTYQIARNIHSQLYDIDDSMHDDDRIGLHGVKRNQDAFVAKLIKQGEIASKIQDAMGIKHDTEVELTTLQHDNHEIISRMDKLDDSLSHEACVAHNEHFVNENENFKKAMDLLLEQIFKVQRNA